MKAVVTITIHHGFDCIEFDVSADHEAARLVAKRMIMLLQEECGPTSNLNMAEYAETITDKEGSL